MNKNVTMKEQFLIDLEKDIETRFSNESVQRSFYDRARNEIVKKMEEDRVQTIVDEYYESKLGDAQKITQEITAPKTIWGRIKEWFQ